MYSLVIIDDEEFILEQLVALFDWEEMGFQLKKSFSLVKEYKTYETENTFDVLLTDIRLGTFSGLDLAREAKQKNPQLEVILISAYSEFNFAKEAIFLKVYDYLLKPITYQAVTDCFLSLKKQLDKARQEQMRLTDKSEKLLSMSRRQIFFDLMAGMIQSRQELSSALKSAELCLSLDKSVFCVVQAEILTPIENESILSKYGREAFYSAIEKICEDTCNAAANNVSVIPTSISEHEIIAIAIAPYSRHIKQCANNIARNIKDLLNITLALRFSQETSDILDPCLQFHNRTFIYTDIVSLANRIQVKLTEDDLKSAFLLLRWGFEDYSNTLDSAIRFALDLAGRMHINPESNFLHLLSSIQSATSVDQIYMHMRNYLSRMSPLYRSTENELYQIELAKQYINKNYMKDLCLVDVANHISLSPVYFSRYFKKNTGERFIDYLCKIRIEKAIELLKDPQNKAYEICNLVGYQSKKHFYRLFKLYTGVTPIEYRNQLLSLSQPEPPS